jgi:PhnB protein
MAKVSTYLNFPRNTWEAFNFYKSVFGGEFAGGGVARFSDFPPAEGAPSIAEEDKNLILHIELALPGGHMLMGSDAPDSMGHHVSPGNNVRIMIDPDSREETKRLFKSLSEGGNVETDLQEMFWGDYYGSCADKFGIHWMFNCTAK